MKRRTRLSDFTFTFHFHALEKEMATHSSVLAWRIPGTGEPGGLPSMGLQSRTRLMQLSSSSSPDYLTSILPTKTTFNPWLSYLSHPGSKNIARLVHCQDFPWGSPNPNQVSCGDILGVDGKKGGSHHLWEEGKHIPVEESMKSLWVI